LYDQRVYLDENTMTANTHHNLAMVYETLEVN